MTDKKPQRTGRGSDGGERPPRRRTPPPATRAEAEPNAPASAFEGERIAKVMARAGACSRRDAEAWIAEGRVSVNGTVLASPAVNVREGDRIEVDGAPLAEREPTRLFLFHKPAGLVTSAKDPEGRDTVFGYLEQHHPDLPRLVSVGRLDINTEGLLLLTNDGGLARTLELPATGWSRRYRVRAHGEIDQARLDELRKGVTVDDIDYAPIEARLDREQGANVWITMALREGKNREIKRVLEHLGLEVNRLIRISFGPFQLSELAEGAVEEVRLKTLREQLGKGLAELAGVDFSSPRRENAEPEHVVEEERRQHAKTRPRKHVSTLRAEREEVRGKGPRARIERSATADRKGRAVAVETITPVRRAEERPVATRNARRFQAERQDNEAPRAEAARVRAPRAEQRTARPERAPPRRRAGEEAEGFRRRPEGEAPRARAPRDDRAERAPPRRRTGEEGEGFRRRPEGEAPRRRDRDAAPAARPGRDDRRAEGPRVGRGRDFKPRDTGDRAETRPRRPRPEGEAPARARTGPRKERPADAGRERFERRDEAPRPSRNRDVAPREGRDRADARPRRPRPEGEAPARARTARKPFDGERRGPPREDRGGKERGPREERAERPRRPRPEGDAPAKRNGPRARPQERTSERPRGARGESEGFERREGAERPRGPRPPRDGAPKREGRPGGSAPAGGKPRGGKFGGGKFGGDKPGGGRPGGKPGGRPSGGKPGGGKPSGGPRKPARPR